MIQLTRLRHDDTFFLNPDLIDRVDVDAVEILHRIVSFRASIIALASLIDVSAHMPRHDGVSVTADDSDWAPRELVPGDVDDNEPIGADGIDAEQIGASQ